MSLLDATADTKEKEDTESTKKDTTSTKTTARGGSRKTTVNAKSDEVISIPRTTVSFDQAIRGISSNFVDENWNTFRKTVEDEVSAIEISQDMNPGTLKVTLQKLSDIRSRIWVPFQDLKSQYENLSSKEPEGLIERIKRINISSASNDMERRKTGVLAVMHHKTPDGEEINLFEVLDEVRTRYTFLRAAMDNVTFKTNALITMNGALKLEQSHIQ